jgi:hypothetical protein
MFKWIQNLTSQDKFKERMSEAENLYANTISWFLVVEKKGKTIFNDDFRQEYELDISSGKSELENMRQNVIALYEKYRDDKKLLLQIIEDWIRYLNIIAERQANFDSRESVDVMLGRIKANEYDNSPDSIATRQFNKELFVGQRTRMAVIHKRIFDLIST